MQKRTVLASNNSQVIDAPVPITGLIVTNPTDSNCTVTSDNGDVFLVPSRTITSYTLPPTLHITAVVGPITNGRVCTVIATDEPVDNSTSQIASLSPTMSLFSTTILQASTIGFGGTVPQNDPLADHLLMVLSARVNEAVFTSNCFIQFNSDANAHYDQQFTRVQGSPPTQTNSFSPNISSLYIGECPGGSAAALRWSQHQIFVDNFQATDRWKNIHVIAQSRDDANGFFQTEVVGVYNQTLTAPVPPISQFFLFPFPGNSWAIGTTLQIYKIGKPQ